MTNTEPAFSGYEEEKVSNSTGLKSDALDALDELKSLAYRDASEPDYIIDQWVKTIRQALEQSLDGGCKNKLCEHRFMELLHRVIQFQVQEPSIYMADGINDLFKKRQASVLDLWYYVSPQPPKSEE